LETSLQIWFSYDIIDANIYIMARLNPKSKM